MPPGGLQEIEDLFHAARGRARRPAGRRGL